MDKRGFLLSSGVTYVGTAVSIACMAAFYGVSLRVGTEAFGALQSIMAWMFLLYAGRAAAASYVVIHAVGRPELLPATARRGLRLALLVGTAIAGAFLLFSPLLRDFLHLDSVTPFFLIGIAAIPTMLSGVIEGTLNVQKRFGALALSSTIIPVANLVLAAVLLRDGFDEMDAGWIILGSQLISCLNVFHADRSLFTGTATSLERASALVQVGTLLAASVLFGASLRMDVFWARHLLSEAEAGAYAIAASIALVLYFVSNGVARVSSVSLRDGGGRRIVAYSYALICATSLVLSLGFALLGETAIALIVGRTIPIDWYVLGPLFASLTCYSIITFDYTCLNVVTKSVHVGIGIALVIVQGAALALLGTDAPSIAWTQFGVMAALMAVFTVSLVRALGAQPNTVVPHPAESHLAHQG